MVWFLLPESASVFFLVPPKLIFRTPDFHRPRTVCHESSVSLLSSCSLSLVGFSFVETVMLLVAILCFVGRRRAIARVLCVVVFVSLLL